MIIQLPVTIEAIEKNADLRPSGKAEDNKILIEFDSPPTTNAIIGKVFRRISGARSGMNFTHTGLISQSMVKRISAVAAALSDRTKPRLGVAVSPLGS
jgi:hypothetical protein